MLPACLYITSPPTRVYAPGTIPPDLHILTVRKSPYKVTSIPQLREYSPQLTKQLLQKFAKYIRSADGGGLKHESSYAFSVSKVIEAVGGLAYLTADNIVKTYLTPHMTQSQEITQSTSTIRVRIYALAHFCAFIQFKNFEHLTALKKRCSTIASRYRKWICSLRSQFGEERAARRDADFHSRLTAEQLCLYRVSDYANGAARSLLSTPVADMDIDMFNQGRNHVIIMLCITNGNRAGVLKNMKAPHLLQPRKGVETEAGGRGDLRRSYRHCLGGRR